MWSRSIQRLKLEFVPECHKTPGLRCRWGRNVCDPAPLPSLMNVSQLLKSKTLWSAMMSKCSGSYIFSHVAAIGRCKDRKPLKELLLWCDQTAKGFLHVSTHTMNSWSSWQLISNSKNLVSLVCQCSNSCRQEIFVSFWTTSVLTLWMSAWGPSTCPKFPWREHPCKYPSQNEVSWPFFFFFFLKEVSVTKDKRDFLTIPPTHYKVRTQFECMDLPFNRVFISTHSLLNDHTHTPSFRWSFIISWSY